ncbi:ATP-dependent Clp protease proteolytic subunit [Streptomyces pacificus]|uniref:ATP-dependent Clp protease proteolytic subunit n=1 Tax=Streptomyces pacificus TaxID=2705029 RepID=A0A6A0AP39_9ACTN|nr:ATP-dependent Clp protease proteolytic subunit [Streptomyces pacificus]GFH34756.1 ATP-dependent Clp protease proteolytic subunit [Streptomyces pacificus]
MKRPSARHVLPEFTEHPSGGQRTLDPYSKLLSERIVLLGAPVDDTSANDVIAQLLYLEYSAPDRDIALYINSPGGPVSAMSAIYDTMQTVACDIATTCLGRTSATAAVLLAAGTPGKRTALAGAQVVIRQPSLPEPVHGQPTDLDLQARELLRLRAQLTAMLARHCGRSPERVAADLERDTVLDAAGAREYGLIDAIIENRKSAPASADGR